MMLRFQSHDRDAKRHGQLQQTGLAMVMIASLLGVFGLLVFKRVQQNRLLADQTREILSEESDDPQSASAKEQQNPALVAPLPMTVASQPRLPHAPKSLDIPGHSASTTDSRDPFLSTTAQPSQIVAKPMPPTAVQAASPWDFTQASPAAKPAGASPESNVSQSKDIPTTEGLMLLFGDEPQPLKKASTEASKSAAAQMPKSSPTLPMTSSMTNLSDPFFSSSTDRQPSSSFSTQTSDPFLSPVSETKPSPDAAPTSISSPFEFGEAALPQSKRDTSEPASAPVAQVPTTSDPWGLSAPQMPQPETKLQPSPVLTDAPGWQVIEPSQTSPKTKHQRPAQTFDAFASPSMEISSPQRSQQPAPLELLSDNPQQMVMPATLTDAMPRFLPPEERINPDSLRSSAPQRTAAREQQSGFDQSFLSAKSASLGNYVVQTGDTFWAISRKQYGTARYFAALEEYNKANLKDGKTLKIGSHLSIPAPQTLEALYPALTGGKTSPVGSVATVQHESAGFFYSEQSAPMYRVGEKDTLTGIAQTHLGRSSRWMQIFEMNKDQLATPDQLKIGMELRLPQDASSVQMTSGQVEYR